MSESLELQGRHWQAQQIQEIGQWVSENPTWSRYRLSRELCTRLDWIRPNGQLADTRLRRTVTIELHHLVKLKTPKLVVTVLPAMTQRQDTRLRKSVDSYLQGIQRKDWVPSPSPMACACCEFFHECRQWGG